MGKIESKDLRLGNCIKLEYEEFNNYSEDSQIDHNNNIWVVESIREDDIWVYNSIENISHTDNTYTFEPIQLTEEILLKCGFKKHLDTIFIHWSKEGGMFEISTRLPYGSFGLWVNGTLGCFQYVHQLQNLYFALTNEELQINL